MRKIRILMMIVLLVLLSVSGCGRQKHYNRTEVAAYLEELFPDDEVCISRQASKERNPDSPRFYADKIWECYFEDLPEVTFEVRSESVYEGLTSQMKLNCNARMVFWQYYLEQYQQEVQAIDQWQLEDGEFDRFVLYFTDLKEVQKAQVELEEFLAWYGQQEYAQEPYRAMCEVGQMPLPSQNLKDIVYVSDADENAVKVSQMVNECDRLLKRYYSYYALLKTPYNREELEIFAQTEWEWPKQILGRLKQAGEPLPDKSFQGIGINNGEISFGGLYQIQERLGHKVSGTPEQFTTVGADGKVYEFSYSKEQQCLISVFDDEFSAITGLELEKK